MTCARPNQRSRLPQAGVTLIEMMIVLAVIATATGAATLGLGALARTEAAGSEAHLLARALGRAMDDVLILGTPLAMDWDAAGYRLGTAARHDLRPGVHLSRYDEGTAAGLLLTADASIPSAGFVLADDATRWRVAFDGIRARVLPGGAP